MKRKTVVFGLMLILLFTVSSGILFSQPPEENLFREAERRFSAGDYELALNMYERFVNEYPYSRRVGEAEYRRAVIRYKLGRFDDSLKLINTLQRKYVSEKFYDQLSFWKGLIFYQTGKYTQAIEQFQQYQKSSDSAYTDQVYLYKGICETYLQDDVKAVGSLEKLIHLDGVKIEPYAYVLLESLYVRQKQYEKALKLLQDVENQDFPREYAVKLKLYKAEALWGESRFDEAEPLYKELLQEKDQKDTVSIAYRRLFSLYYRTNRTDKLQNLVNQAELSLAGQPAVLLDFWILIGIENFNQKKYDLAAAYLSRAWNMRNAAAITDSLPLYLSEVYRINGDTAKGITVLKTYINENGNGDGTVMLKLGSLYMQNKAWQEAQAVYSDIIRLYPDSPHYGDAAYYSAFALYKENENNRALEIIKSTLDEGKAGNKLSKILRLKSVLEIRLNKLDEAIDTLNQYIPVNPKDLSAHMDLLRSYFRIGDYAKSIQEVQKMYNLFPEIEAGKSKNAVLAQYMLGLSCIPGKEYMRAAGILGGITEQAKTQVPSIYPYVLFYQGWALYRSAQYGDALKIFEQIVTSYPDHPLSLRSQYVAGWCAYTTEQFQKASAFFKDFFKQTGTEEMQIKGMFMYGKSMSNLKEYQDAAFTFEHIWKTFPKSNYADDALFEYASLLQKQGDIEGSIAAFRNLYEKYPKSSLAEEAIYKRGELLYQEGEYLKARNAFYDYRVLFPKGDLTDASLYWGGLAYKKSGEPFGAVLLWERLISTFPQSPFRSNAMAETAAIYASSGDLQKALDLYNQLIAAYPMEAKSVGAETERSKLKYLIDGLSNREAELAAVIGKEGGAASLKGRQALLELSRIYIFRGTQQKEMDRAKAMLERVLEKQKEDPESAAHAMYLMGEYYYRQGDLTESAKFFISAATTYTRDRDFMASAMYRAAEISKLAGKMQDTSALVERLEKNFPESQWALEGKKLLEGQK